MILQSMSLIPVSGYVLTAQSLEPASDSVSPTLSPLPSSGSLKKRKETLKMKNHSSFRICEIPFIPDSLTSPSWCGGLIWKVTNNIFDDTYVTRSEWNLQGAMNQLWIYSMYPWLIFPMKHALGTRMDEIMSTSHIGNYRIGPLCLQLLIAISSELKESWDKKVSLNLM